MSQSTHTAKTYEGELAELKSRFSEAHSGELLGCLHSAGLCWPNAERVHSRRTMSENICGKAFGSQRLSSERVQHGPISGDGADMPSWDASLIFLGSTTRGKKGRGRGGGVCPRCTAPRVTISLAIIVLLCLLPSHTRATNTICAAGQHKDGGWRLAVRIPHGAGSYSTWKYDSPYWTDT